jgi:cation:H+ antiporter
MTLAIVFLIIGLVLLVVGADWLVKGASRLAVSFGISSLIIGLTVVAYGTSAPELSVSVMSSMQGKSEIALGNVVGSNIFNVLFILGVSALVTPLIVAKQLIRFDVPVMIGSSILLYALCFDGTLSRVDGVFLFVGAIFYTWWLIRMGRRDAVSANSDESYKPKPEGTLWTNILWIVLGLVFLVVGSKLLVDGAITIAKHFGLSEVIIGLTIIAAGTSLPEVATSVIASFRGERDIAVGNVVGSNIFNILSVMGLSSIVSPAGITTPASILGFDLPVMVAIALACLPIFFSGFKITRWNGTFFLAYHVAYTAYLIFAAKEHDALPLFSKIMFQFVIPITVVTIVTLAIFEIKAIQAKKKLIADQ